MGESERVAQEQSAAEERARLQRERDEKYALDLREAENTKRRLESKLKAELAAAKAEAEATEANLKKNHDALKKSKDIEIDNLNK